MTTIHSIEEGKIIAAIRRFPATFGLRAYGGKFRISPQSSYINDAGEVTLYTEIWNEEKQQWSSFCKGSEQELRQEVQ